MKKMKYLFLMMFCIWLMTFVTACANRTDVSKNDEYIYCLNGEGTGLIKVRFEFPEADTLEVANAVLEELAKPSEEIEYMQAIPDGVKVQNCTMSGVLLYIDFNSEYHSMSVSQEKLMQAAIVQSLLQVDGISGIWFTIDGENLRDEDDRVVGIMNGDDFVQNTETSLSGYQTTDLTLYFGNETGDHLVSQETELKYNSNVSVEKAIVEQLMKGPKKSGAYPTINPQATLLNVTIKEDICYVNFDSEFLNRMYDVKPEVTIYSIVNSLIEGTSAAKVQITVNGEKEVVYDNTVDLSAQFLADYSLLEKKGE